MVAAYPLCTITPSTSALSTVTDRAFCITISTSLVKPISVTLYYVEDVTNADLTPATAQPLRTITFPVPTANVTYASATGYTTTNFDVLLTSLNSTNYTVFGYVSAGSAQHRLVNASGQIANDAAATATLGSSTVTLTIALANTTANLNWALIASETSTGANNELYIIKSITNDTTIVLNRNLVKAITSADDLIIASLVLNSSPPMTKPVIDSVALSLTNATQAIVTLEDDGFLEAPESVQFTIISNSQTGAHLPTALIQTYTYVSVVPLQYTLTGLANDVVYFISAAFLKSGNSSPLSDVYYYATSTSLSQVTNTTFIADLSDGSINLAFNRPIDAEYNVYPVAKYVVELLNGTSGLALSPSQTFIITPSANDTDVTVYSLQLTSANITLGTSYKVSITPYDTLGNVGAVLTSAAVTAVKYLFPINLVKVASTASNKLSAFFTVTPPVTGMGPNEKDANNIDYYWVQPVVNGMRGLAVKTLIVAASQSLPIQELVLTTTGTNGKLYAYYIWPAMTGETPTTVEHSPEVLAAGIPHNPTVPFTPIENFTVTVPSNPVTSTVVTLAWNLSTDPTLAGITPLGYEATVSYTYQSGTSSNPSGSAVFINLPLQIIPAGSTTYTVTIDTTQPIYVKAIIVPYADVNGTVIRGAPTTNYANQSMWGNPTVVLSTNGTSADGFLVTWPQAATQNVGSFAKYTLQLQKQTPSGAAWADVTPVVDVAAITTTSSLAFTASAYPSIAAGSTFRIKMTYTVNITDSNNTTTPVTTLPHFSASILYVVAKPRIMSVTFDSTKKIASLLLAKEGSIITGIAAVGMCSVTTNGVTTVEPVTNIPVFTDSLATDTFSTTLTFTNEIIDLILFVSNAVGITAGRFKPQ